MPNKPKIWLSSPHMGGEEQKFVDEAFESNWIAPLGPNVNGFEDDLKAYVGTKAAGVFTSGTASIHLALILLGVKTGDEVLCQSFTFSATANPITYQGATPVFIDSEPDTWNMDPELLEEAIKDRLQDSGQEVNSGSNPPLHPSLEGIKGWVGGRGDLRNRQQPQPTQNSKPACRRGRLKTKHYQA